ncbi:MAG TPA: response regulator transcription factor [Myxococcales bacterium]|nr:response regulator transcription factor [Myxococcales bacterium]
MSVRVLILHEQRLFREGLRAVLHGRGDLDVVGDTADSATALLLIGETSPDVMVFELWNLARLPRAAHGPPLVALGEDGDRPQVARALQAGVAALVTKSDSPEELAAAIRAAAAGRIYVTPRLCAPGTPLVLQAAPAFGDPLRALTSREREIFTLVISGLSTAAIARRLDLSPRTVETHRGHLSHKLGARSAADLVRFAARTGLLPS